LNVICKEELECFSFFIILVIKNYKSVHYVIGRTDFYMKKIICGLILILSLTIFKELSVSKKIIPDDAIRLRVLANSNSSYDQNVKEKVKTQLQSEVYTHLKDAANIDDARDIIKANIGNFDKSIKKVMEKENYNIGYNIDFGYHYFPN